MDEQRFSIGELADAGGVSRRTVRFYVQRGLIAAPLGVGRGAYYDAGHLAQLLAVKRRQEAGEPLGAIADSEAPEPLPLPETESWSRRVIVSGVELHVRAGALTPAQELAFVQTLQHLVNQVGSEAWPTHHSKRAIE